MRSRPRLSIFSGGDSIQRGLSLNMPQVRLKIFFPSVLRGWGNGMGEKYPGRPWVLAWTGGWGFRAEECSASGEEVGIRDPELGIQALRSPLLAQAALSLCGLQLGLFLSGPVNTAALVFCRPLPSAGSAALLWVPNFGLVVSGWAAGPRKKATSSHSPTGVSPKPRAAPLEHLTSSLVGGKWFFPGEGIRVLCRSEAPSGLVGTWGQYAGGISRSTPQGCRGGCFRIKNTPCGLVWELGLPRPWCCQGWPGQRQRAPAAVLASHSS